MRIALLGWESLHSHYIGGVAVVVSELAASLERKGHEVHVFTRMVEGQSQYDVIDGVHYHRCPFELNHNFIEEMNSMCASFQAEFSRVEDYSGRFDIIHAHDWLATNAMIWIKQSRESQCVLTIHSTEFGRCGNNFHGGESESIRNIERAGTYWADKVTTVSHALRDEVKWMYEVPDEKISMIYNGINPNKFDGFIDPSIVKGQYGVGPVDPTILFCGRLVYQKGPDILVDAIPMVLHHFPNAKFLFAGDGGMRDEVEWKAGELGIQHATRFLGNKNHYELMDLFKACDVVCVPSRNEPFGIVILEAWSAGKPVVTSRNGGPGEFVAHEHNGLQIDPTPESIAWGLGTIFSDFEWLRTMGANGRHAAETYFSWDSIGDQMLDVYSDIII
ncbi:MAG: glycosyltransferase family 4 protein [Planctomycetes bacterium]|nr:glycosyltransferase family 4 protein [Planctomycetota bacterium]